MRNSIILFGFALFVTLVGCTRAKTRHLTVIIDESINEEAQWLYWFSISNEYRLIDSCYVEKGQTVLKLKEYPIQDPIDRIDQLVFSETVIALIPLQFEKYDLDIEIRTSWRGFNDSTFYVKGSQASIERVQYLTDVEIIHKKKRELEELRDYSMSGDNDDNMYKMLSDSLRILNKEYYELALMHFDKSRSPLNSRTLLSSTDLRDSPKTIKDSLIAVMKQKFPNDSLVQIYDLPKHYAKASEESKLILEKIRNITKYVWNKKTQTDKNIPSINGSLAQQIKESQQKVFAKDSVQSRSYTLGDRVQGVELLGMNNKGISLDDIGSKYILIDFWADWCAPCIREFAHVENVQTTYKDILTVYAISLDNNEAIWRTAIAKHNLELFTNVYAGNWLVDETKDFTNRFGIKSIPANFLLDKDRRIIAINLRGEALEKKMKELTK